MVFTTPLLGALKRRFPGARLTYLVESVAAPVVRYNRDIDELIEVRRPRGWPRLEYDWTLGRQLRRRGFDIALDLHGGPRAAWLTRVSGAPIRIGYDLPWRRWAYTVRVPWTPSLVPPRHSVLNQWDLLRPLGIEAGDPARDPVTMPLDPAAVARVDERCRDAGVPADARLAVLHVSAGNPFRRWPAERFAELAASLANLPQPVHVVITSGPSEADAASRVATLARQLARDDGERIVRCGEFDLSELAALVTRARLYIGGDSGPMHVAATTRTPIVALFGPTLPERSLPWRDPAVPSMAVEAGPLPCRPCHQRTCLPGDFRCLTGITVRQVLDACVTALGGTHA
ncbi:MAG TPA: glycosyltransferase family 9 protein [Vicinamibacterales bacterium]|nr:glycosyltransferase family 9 protein [Vicinamibacterales bacterium]